MSASDEWLFDRLKPPGQPRSVPNGAQWVSANPRSNDSVARMSNTEKLKRTLLYAIASPELPGEVKQALLQMVQPTNLAITAGMLAAWIASHAIGVGEAFDVVMAGVVAYSLGTQAVQGLIELVEFARDVIQATSDRQLQAAASRLTRAIALLGVEVVVSLLMRGAKLSRRGQGGSRNSAVESPPPSQGAAQSGGVAAPKAKPPVEPKASEGANKLTQRVPGRVQSRINLANDGWTHVVKRHFSGKSNASQFTINQKELRDLLQSKAVVRTPVTRTLESEDGLRFVRDFDAGRVIGVDKFSGNSPTRVMSILTDTYGNLVTVSPGVIK